MRCLCFLLFPALLPLDAQMSLDNSAKVYPATPPAAADIVLAPGSASTAISTNVTLPAPPLMQAKLTRFTISPGIVREGLTYREGAKTIATLSGPVTKQSVFQVVSSDSNKVACGPITFLKGQQEQNGALEIKWKNITEDCQIAIKVYDPNHPDTVLRSRLYLRKNPEARIESRVSPSRYWCGLFEETAFLVGLQ